MTSTTFSGQESLLSIMRPYLYPDGSLIDPRIVDQNIRFAITRSDFATTESNTGRVVDDPRAGGFESVVAKLKIEIILFDGQRPRLKSGLTKVSPMPPDPMILVDEMGFEPTTSSLRTVGKIS